MNGQTNPKVDAFVDRANNWRDEIITLRSILLKTELTEEFKWGKPCYSFENSNIVNIIPFKETCALMFFKGALLSDPQSILIQPTENSQSSRQLRFTSVKEIEKMEAVIVAYIREAIDAEKAGLKIEFTKSTDYSLPEELEEKLDSDPALKTAFYALTPGRQRAYYLFISAAKQSKTRTARAEKCIPQILAGKGLND